MIEKVNNIVNIAFGATSDWLEKTRITVVSVLMNTVGDSTYHFYIMSDKFDSDIKEKFEKLKAFYKKTEFHFLEMNEKWFEGAVHDHLGVSSSYRLKLPSLVNVDKILYLDSDIIVKGDIGELYNYDISDYYIAAVEDKCSKMMKIRVKLDEEQTFINGGMQLMNLCLFRKDNLEEKIFDKLRKISFYTDQDVINDICREKILQLPLKYNLMPTGIYSGREMELQQTLKAPFIIHYEIKPWKNADTPFASHWLYYEKCIQVLDNNN